MALKEVPDFKDKKKYPHGVESYRSTLNEKEKKMLDDWLEYRSMKAKENKVAEYRRYVLIFRYVLDKPLTTKYTLQDVKDFLKVFYNSSRGDEEKHAIGSVLFSGKKAFLKFHFRDWSARFNNFQEAGGDDLIAWGVKKLQDRLTDNDLLTDNEIEAIVRIAERLRDKALIMTIGESMARPSEILNLKWKDIDFQRNVARVIATKTNNIPREVPIKLSAIHLKRWKEEYCFPKVSGEDFVFVSPQDRMRPLSTQNLWYNLKRLSKKVGIEKRVYAYLCRHSKITDLQEKGVSLTSVMALAGHKNINTTMRYTHISKKRAMQEVLEKVYNIQELKPEKKHELELEIDKLRQERADDNEKYQMMAEDMQKIRQMIAKMAGAKTV